MRVFTNQWAWILIYLGIAVLAFAGCDAPTITAPSKVQTTADGPIQAARCIPAGGINGGAWFDWLNRERCN